MLQTYMRNYDDPVIRRNNTPISGRILWARHLAQRLEVFNHFFRFFSTLIVVLGVQCVQPANICCVRTTQL